MISVIFPAYNEEKNVAELHRRLVYALKETGEEFEIIAVDNASVDDTHNELRKLSPIKIIRIAYNIGQTAAIDAGIQEAEGDIIVTIDADLQNDPSDVPEMFRKLNEGYDAVLGWRQNRHDSVGRKIFSDLANWLTRKVFGFHMHDYACALKMFKKKYLGGVRLYGEMHVFLAALLHYKGARIAEIPIKHHERARGLSKHTFIKGVKDVADLLTIKFLIGTSRPLLVFGALALFLWFIGSATAVWSVVLKIIELRNFGETPLPLVTAFMGIIGLVLFMMGFLAEIMLRIYYESGGKRPYTIKEIIENK